MWNNFKKGWFSFVSELTLSGPAKTTKETKDTKNIKPKKLKPVKKIKPDKTVTFENPIKKK